MPWIEAGEDPGWWWVDVDQLTEDNLAVYSGGETRVLRIAAALLGGRPAHLYRDIPGLDRDYVQLVLAAIAHASGSHEHSGPLVPDPHGRYLAADGARMSISRPGSLYPWPERE